MAKFDIRKFAKENKEVLTRDRNWMTKAIASDAAVGWQIVDLVKEWLGKGPIRKEYPEAHMFGRMLCKIDCVTASDKTIYRTLKELEDGQRKLPSR
jgi:hypothetical protein